MPTHSYCHPPLPYSIHNREMPFESILSPLSEGKSTSSVDLRQREKLLLIPPRFYKQRWWVTQYKLFTVFMVNLTKTLSQTEMASTSWARHLHTGMGNFHIGWIQMMPASHIFGDIRPSGGLTHSSWRVKVASYFSGWQPNTVLNFLMLCAKINVESHT